MIRIMRPGTYTVKAMCPCCDVGGPPSKSPIPTPLPQFAGHTAVMGMRFAVQADTEAECAEGLQQLLALGLVPAMLPKQLTDNRWMARAVPGNTKAPTDGGVDRGQGGAGSWATSRRCR